MKFLKRFELLLIVALSILTPGCVGNPIATRLPSADHGVMDLRGWDLEKSGPIELKGEWEFFWQQLIEPDGIDDRSHKEDKRLINLPGIWNDYEIDGVKLDGDGFATYRLIVRLKDKDQQQTTIPHQGHSAVIVKNESGFVSQACHSLAFEYRFQETAFTVFVNGTKISSIGTVSTNAETASPEYRPHVAEFVVCDDQLDIVVHVSNYHHRKGGLQSAIVFGLNHQVHSKWENRRIFDVFLFGSILMMAFYHFSLFFLRRQNRSTLYFGVFCLLISIRGIVVGQYFILKLLPGLNWELLIRIEYLAVYLPFIFISLFLNSLFPREFPRWLLKGIIGVSIFYALTLIGPIKFSSHFITSYQILLIIATICIAGVLTLVVVRKREGSIAFILGYVVLFATLINDILYNRMIISSSMLFPFGLFFFIFAQSYVLSLHFSKAFNEVEDLTDELEERNRRLTELDRLKDEFLTNTSHELKTPLTGIIGIAESLVEGVAGELPETAQQNLMMLISSGRRLGNLVNDILDFSKLRHADINLSKTSIHLATVTEMVLTFSRMLVGDKPVTLQNSISHDLPLVLADENRIQQILMNLVGNAIKFTKEGQVSVEAAHVDDFIQVSILDTGIGVPKNKLSAIFSSFEQVDGSIEREFGGTGLGLAITKKLVELHGGTIGVESIEGSGSVFRFTLPIADEQTVPATSPSSVLYEKLSQSVSRLKILVDEESPEKSTDLPGGSRILIVDDEPLNIRVLQNQLQMNNYDVMTAQDGFKALEKLESEKPDLIILDLMMPYMSGYEFCTKVRETYKASELPIIILTAKNQVEDLVKGLDCGANDYITKPFSKQEIVSRIENQLKLRRFSEELLKVNLDLEALNQSLEKKVLDRTHQLADSNDQMKQLLQILCHDLLNPFSSLHGILELISFEPEQFDKMKEYMQIAVDNGIAIIEMVRRMKPLDENTIQDELKMYRLKDLVTESRHIFSQRLNNKRLSLVEEVADDIFVEVEKTSFINSVLNNILSNAIKFSYPGGDIRINAEEVNDKVVISVRDYGIGIPSWMIADLYKLDRSTSRKGTEGETGTGYGLSLIKQIVTAYGGSVDINSNETSAGDVIKGTEVKLILKSGSI